MKFQLIHTLSESRMFRSVDALDKYDSNTKNNLLYACFLSTIALCLDVKTSRWGREYAGKTAAFSNFDYFRSTGTDLYVLAYDAQLRLGSSFGTVESSFIVVLKGLSRGDVDQSLVESTLLKLERVLGISDSRLRGARRDIAHWGESTPANRARAVNDLYRIIKSESSVAEVLPFLLILTKGDSGGLSTLGKIATTAAAGLGALALGFWHGYNSAPRKKWSLLDDKEQKDE